MSQDKFSELLECEFDWPTAGDKIFVDAQARGVQIDEDVPSRTHHILDGNKMAATILMDAAAKSFDRKLIYPLVFCYRHALELTLKGVLYRHGAAAGETPNYTDHDLLEKLWPSVRRVLQHYRIASDDPALLAVEACIAEFSKIDLGSFTFRYPTNRSGQPIPILCRPSLEQLRDTMGSIFQFFECVEMQIDAYEDHLEIQRRLDSY